MKRYSQNKEQDYILDYFKDTGYKNLNICDVGSNDGETFSNSYALILLGASATLIEPSETAFTKLKNLHRDNPKVKTINVAIGTTNGTHDFYESGTHLGKGDTSLLSTLHKSELKRWEKSNNQFTHAVVETMTYKALGLDKEKFDFITIDAEGNDIVILKQIDLTHTKLLCIEYNSNPSDKAEILQYCKGYGLDKLIYENAENLLIAR